MNTHGLGPRLRLRIGDLLVRLGLKERPIPNLQGDRDLEWSWMAARIPQGSGRALDFGCGQSSFLGLTAAHRGYRVTAVDLTPVRWSYRHRQLEFMQGDVAHLGLAPNSFDLILNCSTIEHVGLAGRYGSADRPDGDIEAMTALHSLLKEEGRMVMTIPVGLDAVFAPFHRVYGKERLALLLSRWSVEWKEFWIKDGTNCWVKTEESVALNQKSSAVYYGLGFFILRRSAGA
ncbi:MAG: DUF268 domain-containing protein [Nitrospirota bacterium]